MNAATVNGIVGLGVAIAHAASTRALPEAETVAKDLVNLALELVPVDVLKTYLPETAREQIDAAADLLEDAKFPDSEDPAK